MLGISASRGSADNSLPQPPTSKYRVGKVPRDQQLCAFPRSLTAAFPNRPRSEAGNNSGLRSWAEGTVYAASDGLACQAALSIKIGAGNVTQTGSFKPARHSRDSENAPGTDRQTDRGREDRRQGVRRKEEGENWMNISRY